MTTAKTPVVPDTEGYWTIQIIQQDRAQTGHRHACHARDDAQAQSIALLLAGSARSTVGYNYHRINNPTGKYALAMAVGQSETVNSPEAWTALQAARRDA